MNLSNKMAATSPELCTCPFCGLSFKRLGSHLPLCKNREGRDYEYLLSANTLAKRCKSKKKACPVCNKRFSRLDTHLRLSRSCQVYSSVPREEPINEDTPQQISVPPNPNPIPVTATQLRTLKMPKSDEEWVEVDRAIADSVVPAVLAASTVDDKNTQLCQGVYQLFASKFGCASTHKPRRQRKHARRLKRLTSEKKAKSSFVRPSLPPVIPQSSRSSPTNSTNLYASTVLKRKSSLGPSVV